MRHDSRFDAAPPKKPAEKQSGKCVSKLHGGDYPQRRLINRRSWRPRCPGRMRATAWIPKGFQYKDGVIEESVAKAYFGIIALHLGIPRTRHWWSTVGRIGFNSEFVAEVDAFLADRETISYFEDVTSFDSARKKADHTRV